LREWEEWGEGRKGRTRRRGKSADPEDFSPSNAGGCDRLRKRPQAVLVIGDWPLTLDCGLFLGLYQYLQSLMVSTQATGMWKVMM